MDYNGTMSKRLSPHTCDREEKVIYAWPIKFKMCLFLISDQFIVSPIEMFNIGKSEMLEYTALNFGEDRSSKMTLFLGHS